MNDKKQCERCGTCCRNGGPALHGQDMKLIEEGTLPLSSLVTLRPGERAYDQLAQQVLPLKEEILKIKGRDGKWTCHFFSPEGQTCAVYETRPIECEVLFCGDIAPLSEMYTTDRLTRKDVLPDGHPIIDLIEEHNVKCDPIRLEKLAMAARQGDAASGEQLREMVLFDMEVRRLVPEKAGTSPEMNDFFFGRPLRVLLRTMNINVYEVADSIRFGF